MSETIYLVMSDDPYASHNTPYPETAHTEERHAKRECVRRYEQTFGNGSWRKDARESKKRYIKSPESYFYVKPIELK